MYKVFIFNKLNEKISDKVREEILALSSKIERYKKEGNNKKIIQLEKSNILSRIHLSGRHRRVVFSYINNILKIYDFFEASGEKEKIRRYDKLCATENNFLELDFIDITPLKEEKSEEEITSLKKILETIENSAIMGIPTKGKLSFDNFITNINKQKWIRKYPQLKELFYKLRHEMEGDLKLIVILQRVRKRENEGKLIKLFLTIKSSSALRKEINARLKDKPIIKASIQLRRMK